MSTLDMTLLHWPKEGDIRKLEAACGHEWEPWFTAVRDHDFLILFPGERCVKCHTVNRCARNECEALENFQNRFGRSFSDFAGENSALAQNICTDAGMSGWGIADHDDYFSWK